MKEGFISAFAEQLADWIAARDEKAIRPHSWLSKDLQGVISYDKTFRNNATLLRHIAAKLPERAKIVDFGCGDLPSKNLFDRLDFDWVGLDLSDSVDPAYEKGKNAQTGKIVYYDGSRIPFNDGEFDMLWSTQALEHVQDLDETYAEISRVVKPGGYFVGSASFLEPYHARSTFSYTPYGFQLLLQKYGFALQTICPGVDGLTLLLKRLSGIMGDAVDWQEIHRQGGLLNSLVEKKLLDSGRTESDVAALLLQICGHFRFVARRNVHSSEV